MLSIFVHHVNTDCLSLMHCSAATYGSCVKVLGTLRPSDYDRQPVEVKAETIEVIGSCYFKVCPSFCRIYTRGL